MSTVSILVANAKGGCGKTTIATNLATAFANAGLKTALADADRQKSSLGWLNGPIAKIISKTRAPTSREGYAAIGGGSPQLDTTIKQGQALEAAMRKLHGIEAKSYVAMRYWYPFTSDALEAIKRDGIERLVVVPLYPQFSISTSGSSLRVLEKEFYADQELRQMRNTVLPAC